MSTKSKFDWTQFDIESNLANPGIAEPGIYKVVITGTKEYTLKDDKGESIIVDMQIVDDPRYDGIALSEFLNLLHVNERARSMAKHTLAMIMRSLGIDEVPPDMDFDLLPGHELRVDIGIKEYNGKTRNFVKGYPDGQRKTEKTKHPDAVGGTRSAKAVQAAAKPEAPLPEDDIPF